MGGKVYDRKTLVVDRDPTRQLAVELGNLKDLDPAELIRLGLENFSKQLRDFGLEAFKQVTGIDLSSWAAFLDDLPGFDASKIVSGLFSGSLIPGLDASKIISGSFPMERVTGLLDALASGDISGIVEALTGIAGGGLPDLEDWAALVPKLTGGQLSGSVIPGIDASKIVSGLLSGSLIPNLPASIINSGVFGAGLIPSLDASKIGSGTFADGLLPGLGSLRDAIGQAVDGGSTTGYTAAQVKSKLQAFPGGNLVGTVAAGLLSGTIAAGLIPGLDASKIISGAFPQSMITGLSSIAADTSNAVNGLLNFINQWNGTSVSTLNPADITNTTASIRSAINAGFSVVIKSASDPAWLVPAGTTKLIGIAINGGGKGGTGTTSAGGVGGINGGCLGGVLDMTGITPGVSTLAITVGAPASTAGAAPAQANGGVSSIKFGATTLLSGAANANGYYDGVSPLYSYTTSVPGSGGKGGFSATSGTAANGEPGENSAVADGGAAGIGKGSTSPGLPGGNGGNGIVNSVPVAGGGGGGGGGNCQQGTGISAATAGNGGNGGDPGGGSGGGGSAVSNGSKTQGVGGTPGAGRVILMYKAA